MKDQIGEIVAEMREWLSHRWRETHGEYSLIEAWADKLEALGGWQDISNAPKDGTEVLVCKWPLHGPKPEESFGIFVHRAAWWSSEGDGEWIVYNSMVCEPTCHFTPTHWQTIPAPPKESCDGNSF